MLDETVEKAVDKYIEQITQMQIDKDRYLSVPQVAKLSGFSSPAVRGWINQKCDPLPAFRIGRDYKIKMNES